MTETSSNVEFAQHIPEHGHSGTGPHSPRTERLEILEALVLSAVAVLTAWSSYQAASWDGKSAESYVQSAGATTRAQEQQTLAGQERLYDITTFNGWLEARVNGKAELAAAFERRFRPEYAVAFAAWLKTDPLTNANAPAGAIFMQEYRNANLDEAKRLADEAKRHFENGAAHRRPRGRLRQDHRAPRNRAAADRLEPAVQDSRAATRAPRRRLRHAGLCHLPDRHSPAGVRGASDV